MKILMAAILAAILIGSSVTSVQAYLTPVYRATWTNLNDPTGANDAFIDTYSEWSDDSSGTGEFRFNYTFPSDLVLDKAYLTVYSTNINTLPGDVSFRCESNDYSVIEQVSQFDRGTQVPVNISSALFDPSVGSNLSCFSQLNFKDPSNFHFNYGRASGGSVGSFMRFHMATIQLRYGIIGQDGSFESDEIIDPNQDDAYSVVTNSLGELVTDSVSMFVIVIFLSIGIIITISVLRKATTWFRQWVKV